MLWMKAFSSMHGGRRVNKLSCKELENGETHGTEDVKKMENGTTWILIDM